MLQTENRQIEKAIEKVNTENHLTAVLMNHRVEQANSIRYTRRIIKEDKILNNTIQILRKNWENQEEKLEKYKNPNKNDSIFEL